jgi:hypothetical protein
MEFLIKTHIPYAKDPDYTTHDVVTADSKIAACKALLDKNPGRVITWADEVNIKKQHPSMPQAGHASDDWDWGFKADLS